MSGSPPAGRSVTMPEGADLAARHRRERQRGSQWASTVSASAVAKRMPTQRRGPPPKGIYWKRWRAAFASGSQRSGSNSSGSSHSASWRWSSHGQIETMSPGRDLLVPEPVRRHGLAVEARRGRIETERLLQHHREAAAGGRGGPDPRRAASALGRLRGHLMLKLRLLRKQVQRPGHRIGRGLVAGEVEGHGIVHRQRRRLLRIEPVVERADQPAEKVVGAALRQPLANHRLERVAQIGHAAIRRPALAAPGHSGQAEHRLQPRLAHALERRGDMRHGGLAGEPRVAAEQGVGDDPYRRLRRLGGHVADAGLPPFERGASHLAEQRHQRVDRGRREIGGDDPPLLAPEAAVRGEETLADRRREQLLDDLRLGIIGGIVEQHPLHRVGIERDVDPEAEDLSPHIGEAESLLRPAVHRGARPLPEKAAPAGDGPGAARRVRGDEAGGSRVHDPL